MELVKLLKWQLMILHRNNLIVVSIAVTLVYTVMFFALRGLGNLDKVLTLLIYNDPAIIGLFFVGLSIIIEKNQQVFPALIVSPMSHHAYLVSKIIALSIIGTGCALGMLVAVRGFSVNFALFTSGAFFTTTIFGIVGIVMVSYTTEFLSFMLRSVPVLLVFSLPLFNYFNLTDVSLFYLTPIQGSLNLITNSYEVQAHSSEVWYGFISSIFWIVVLYLGAFRIFENRMIKSR